MISKILIKSGYLILPFMQNEDPQIKLFNQFIRLLIKFGVQALAKTIAKQAYLILNLRILNALSCAILFSLNQM
jgi:hypothetical protein